MSDLNDGKQCKKFFVTSGRNIVDDASGRKNWPCLEGNARWGWDKGRGQSVRGWRMKGEERKRKKANRKEDSPAFL